MATCAYCETTILFGGERLGGARYCNETCLQNAALTQAASQLSPYDVHRNVKELHQGNCPRCQGPGPVDVHVSHHVWSALVVTRYSSSTIIGCKKCGNKARIFSSVLSLVFGWWGIPWGLIMTPVQIGRNVVGMLSVPDGKVPSPALQSAVRLQMAASTQGESRDLTP
jgi:hypothetical protein